MVVATQHSILMIKLDGMLVERRGVQIAQRDGFCLDPDPMPQAVVHLFLSTYCDSPSNTPRAVVSGNGDDLVLDLLVAPRA